MNIRVLSVRLQRQREQYQPFFGVPLMTSLRAEFPQWLSHPCLRPYPLVRPTDRPKSFRGAQGGSTELAKIKVTKPNLLKLLNRSQSNLLRSPPSSLRQS